MQTHPLEYFQGWGEEEVGDGRESRRERGGQKSRSRKAIDGEREVSRGRMGKRGAMGKRKHPEQWKPRCGGSEHCPGHCADKLLPNLQTALWNMRASR